MKTLVNPNGSKLWKFKYRFSGVEKKLSFGAFSDVSLAAARDARDEARRQLTNTIDPGILKNSIYHFLHKPLRFSGNCRPILDLENISFQAYDPRPDQ